LLLDDYPAAARFLTPDEKAMVLNRLEEDHSALDEGWDAKYAWDAVKDWKVCQTRAFNSTTERPSDLGPNVHLRTYNKSPLSLPALNT